LIEFKLNLITYIDGKKHFGSSSPANPALITPDPFKDIIIIIVSLKLNK